MAVAAAPPRNPAPGGRGLPHGRGPHVKTGPSLPRDLAEPAFCPPATFARAPGGGAAGSELIDARRKMFTAHTAFGVDSSRPPGPASAGAGSWRTHGRAAGLASPCAAQASRGGGALTGHIPGRSILTVPGFDACPRGWIPAPHVTQQPNTHAAPCPSRPELHPRSRNGL